MTRRTSLYLSIAFLILICVLFVVSEKYHSYQFTGKTETSGSSLAASLLNLGTEARHPPKSDRELRKSVDIIEPVPDGLKLTECPLNQLLQLLAGEAGLNFVANPDLESDKFLVNGVISKETLENKESLINAIDALAFQYNVLDYVNGDNLEIVTREQLETYPLSKFSFALSREKENFTEPKQIIDALFPQYLSPHRKSAEFEFDAQTGTLTVTDTPFRTEKMEAFLKRHYHDVKLVPR